MEKMIRQKTILFAIVTFWISISRVCDESERVTLITTDVSWKFNV